MFRRFVRDTRGATAIEYALIAGLVSVMLVAGATMMGTKLNATFTSAASSLK